MEKKMNRVLVSIIIRTCQNPISCDDYPQNCSRL